MYTTIEEPVFIISFTNFVKAIRIITKNNNKKATKPANSLVRRGYCSTGAVKKAVLKPCIKRHTKETFWSFAFLMESFWPRDCCSLPMPYWWIFLIKVHGKNLSLTQRGIFVEAHRCTATDCCYFDNVFRLTLYFTLHFILSSSLSLSHPPSPYPTLAGSPAWP